MLKVGATDLLLRMIEAGVPMRDMTLENPIRAIREISHDLTGRKKVRLANGRELSALEIQTEYLDRAQDFVDRRGPTSPSHKAVLELWRRTITAVDSGDLSAIEREIDWAIKYRLLERAGRVERVASDIEIFEAKSVPPQTTRAKLRGDFVRRAQEQRRDFTVDWVHLKLNDQAQRTVLCKDPFRSVDERVDRLIASL